MDQSEMDRQREARRLTVRRSIPRNDAELDSCLRELIKGCEEARTGRRQEDFLDVTIFSHADTDAQIVEKLKRFSVKKKLSSAGSKYRSWNNKCWIAMIRKLTSSRIEKIPASQIRQYLDAIKKSLG